MPNPPTRIYLDNAATTRVDDAVLLAMLPHLQDAYGNPSALYSYGREARLAVELARKRVATCLGVSPKTLVFTSGGTESNNMAIICAVRDLGCTHILYSPTEHHSVLHTVQQYGEDPVTRGSLRLRGDGQVDYLDLEDQLAAWQSEGKRCLVCLMHGNNETGVITDLMRVGRICRAFDAVFFSDCVCTIGYYPINLEDLLLDLASAAAHKFHGPKGAGLLYIREDLPMGPLLHGGGQELGRRPGTESVAGIVGLAHALTIAHRNHESHSTRIRNLQLYMLRKLQESIPDVHFNGNPSAGLYTILSVSLPRSEKTDGLLLELDLRGICASSGSACTAGAGSHVMEALGKTDQVNIRFSFSKWNTVGEIDKVIAAIAEILSVG